MKTLSRRGGDRVHRFEIYKCQNVQDNIKAFLAELTTCCRAAPLDSGALQREPAAGRYPSNGGCLPMGKRTHGADRAVLFF